jgi:hypothetical protein
MVCACEAEVGIEELGSELISSDMTGSGTQPAMSLVMGGGDIWLPGQLLEVPWLEGCPFCVPKVGNGDESRKVNLLGNPEGGGLMVDGEEGLPYSALWTLETR